MPSLLLLHGAIGAKDQLQPLSEILKEQHAVYSMNFSGHGGNDIPSGELSIQGLANEILHFIETNQLQPVYIFGYSMGGYAAMYLARHYPGKIKGIITLGTKFHWDEPTAAKEAAMLNAEKLLLKVPAFAKELEERHAPADWKLLLDKTVSMLINMGKNNPLQLNEYTNISIPCLLMLGDRDKMVSLEETVAVYQQLPNAGLSVLPGMGHPIEKSDPYRLSFEISSFIHSTKDAINH